jgi:hypothetical protein
MHRCARKAAAGLLAYTAGLSAEQEACAALEAGRGALQQAKFGDAYEAFSRAVELAVASDTKAEVRGCRRRCCCRHCCSPTHRACMGMPSSIFFLTAHAAMDGQVIPGGIAEELLCGSQGSSALHRSCPGRPQHGTLGTRLLCHRACWAARPLH